MGEAGIYTLVDAHQDLLARTVCGEGMPNFYAKEILEKEPKYCYGKYWDWVFGWYLKWKGQCKSMKDYDLDYDTDGNPTIPSCQKYNFGSFYGSPEVQTLFRALYDNNQGLQDKFVAYWVHVAKRFANNQYVMGFDPLNEPESSADILRSVENIR